LLDEERRRIAATEFNREGVVDVVRRAATDKPRPEERIIGRHHHRWLQLKPALLEEGLAADGLDAVLQREVDALVERARIWRRFGHLGFRRRRIDLIGVFCRRWRLFTEIEITASAAFGGWFVLCEGWRRTQQTGAPTHNRTPCVLHRFLTLWSR
jgi:hypothetical protein